eukprot:517613-Rhodomonas_salina.3
MRTGTRRNSNKEEKKIRMRLQGVVFVCNQQGRCQDGEERFNAVGLALCLVGDPLRPDSMTHHIERNTNERATTYAWMAV